MSIWLALAGAAVGAAVGVALTAAFPTAAAAQAGAAQVTADSLAALPPAPAVADSLAALPPVPAVADSLAVSPPAPAPAAPAGGVAALAAPDSAAAPTQGAAGSAGPSSGAAAAPAPAATRTHVVAPGGTIDRVIGGEPVTLLRGPVTIERDSLTVRADSVLYYRNRDVYDAGGHVQVLQGGSVLTSAAAQVRRREDAADFEGEVRVEDEDVIGTAERAESRGGGSRLRLLGEARLVSPEYTVWADAIERDRAEDTGEATGRVKIVDPAAQSVVMGEHATFRRREGTAVVDRDPVLTTREQGESTLTGMARLMRFQRNPERVVMIDSVRIRQGRTDARADTAVIVGRERLLLRGSPCVRDGSQSTMTAREIELIYREAQLDRMLLVGQARVEDAEPESLAAHYRGLPSLNTLTGDTIVVQFVDGRPSRSTVLGTAASVYVPEDTSDEIACNDVKGDTIIIDFRDERVQRVRVQGHMSGTYRFLRRDREKGGAAAGTAQSAAGSESPKGAAGETAADTALADTALAGASLAGAAADSAAAGKAADFAGQAETVTYRGHEVTFYLGQRRIEVEKQAELEYGTLKLAAKRVRLDTVRRELYADGDPLLEDGTQKMIGRRMGYDFEHKSGAALDGVTAEDQNFYAGRSIKRFADGTLKIESGRMTSCDLDKPHYHFWAKKMKIKLNERVVAAPVVIKVGEVPLFALPFYFKSLKSGRRSGILFPNFEFGWSRREGRYIRDWGYYWATNEYTDFTLRGDYNERRNLVLELINKYAKRYAFTGDFRFAKQFSLDERNYANRWQFTWNHNQPRLFDAYAFRAAVDMSSAQLENSYLGSNVGRDIIPGQLQSNVYLSRSWSAISGSLSASRSQRINAEDDVLTTDQSLSTTSAPRLSLNFSRRPVLPPLPAGRRGSPLADVLRNTYFSHSYDFSHAREEREESSWRTTSGSGRVSVEVRPPRLGWLNLSTGVQASQSWTRLTGAGRRYVRTDTTWAAPDTIASLDPVYADLDSLRETTRPSLSIGSSAGTTLYGVFPLHIGRLQAIRHTFTFSASHSWAPSLGSKQFQSSSFSFTVGNRFDVKYLAAGGDTAKAAGAAGRGGGGAGTAGGARGGGAGQDDRVRKLDGLLDWSLSTSYLPNQPAGQRWSDISSGIMIKPGRSRNLDVRIQNTIDSRSLAVKSTAVNYGLSLSGRLATGGRPEPAARQRRSGLERLGIKPDSTATAPVEGRVPEEQPPDEDYESAFAGFPRAQKTGAGQDPTEGGQFIPWNLSSRFSYSRDNRSGYASKRVSVTVGAQLTPSWAFNYDASLDLEAGEIQRQSWALTRDLHCWALAFTRVVSTVDSQFGFRLYLKSIPAVEVTRGQRDLLGTAQALGAGGIF